MDRRKIIFGILIMIILVFIGLYIYSRPKVPTVPTVPSIKLFDGSAILNPGEERRDREGYMIEYAAGEFTDDDLTDFVNIKVKWTNLGGFSRVKRLKLTLMNDGTVIQPSKVFSKSVSDDSEYFGDFSGTLLEYTFVGTDVTDGNFIGTIKPKFEYSLSSTGDEYRPLSLTNDLTISINKDQVTLSLDDGISTTLTYTPIISTKAGKIPEISSSFDSDGYIFTNGTQTLNKQFNDEKLYIISATVNKSDIFLRTNDKWVNVDSSGNLYLTEFDAEAYIFRIFNDPGYDTDYYYIVLQSTDGNKVVVYNTASEKFQLINMVSVTPGQYDSMILSYRQRYVTDDTSVIIKLVSESDDKFVSLKKTSGGTSQNPGDAECVIKKVDMKYVAPRRQCSDDDTAAEAQRKHTSTNAGFFTIKTSDNKYVQLVPGSSPIKHTDYKKNIIVRWKDTKSYFFRVSDGFDDIASTFEDDSITALSYVDTEFPDGDKYFRVQFFIPEDTEYKYPLEIKYPTTEVTTPLPAPPAPGQGDYIRLPGDRFGDSYFDVPNIGDYFLAPSTVTDGCNIENCVLNCNRRRGCSGFNVYDKKCHYKVDNLKHRVEKIKMGRKPEHNGPINYYFNPREDTDGSDYIKTMSKP